MADLNVQLIAAELGKSLEDASEKVTAELNSAIRDLAHAAHANIIAHVQGSSMNPKNRQDYLKALKFQEIGDNSYVIYLDGEWPTKLEEGFEAYDMKEVLLSSDKTVGVGPRSGEPWVRTNKDGGKYAAVPFEHKPHSKQGGDLAKDIKSIFAKNRQGKEQKITKTFTDDFGKPIAGKVASVRGEGIPDNLQGLTKYQHVSKSGRVSSIYMTFRMVSEKSTGWMHPGHPGYHYFKKVEQELEKELENIITTLL